jgi:hypothetical protein
VRVDRALEAVVAASVLVRRAVHPQRAAAVVRARLVLAGSFASGIGLRKRRLDCLVLCGEEDDLMPYVRSITIYMLYMSVLTFEFADLAIACMASRYRICMAGAELKISAAWATSVHIKHILE